MPNYVKCSYIKERFDISHTTLRRWADSGKIRIVTLPGGGQRLYDYEHFLTLVGAPDHTDTTVTRKRICYARVSSSHQKEDLVRQIQYLQDKFPDTEIIKDVGSGLNWHRKGIQSLLDQVVGGTVEEIVVTNKDRLCRFGYELLEWLFKKFNCKIMVLNESTDATPEIELSQDVLSVINYFTAKNNGMRSAQNRKNRATQVQKSKTLPNNTGKGKVNTVVRSVEVDL
jgi:predicted site-specific integrase-resolvase